VAFTPNKEPAKEESINGTAGKKKYGRMVRMFREGYLSVCIYKNVFERKTFYDIVIYRKIKGSNGEYDYRRGTNLKPSDLPVLLTLVAEARDFLTSLESENNSAQ
jgi:hypothetical protein